MSPILYVHTVCEASRVHLSQITGHMEVSQCLKLTGPLKTILFAAGDAPNSPLHTQMSSTHWNLEGSPSAAAPDYSPDSKQSHVQTVMTNGNRRVDKTAYRYTCCQR